MKPPDVVRLEWHKEPYAVVFKSSDVPVEGDHGSHSVAAWAAQALGGTWLVHSAAGAASAGLLLLARPGCGALSVRGTYALLITAKSAPDDFKQYVVDAFDFFGGPDQEARLVSSTPSGHFAHIAVVEIDCCLTGRTALTPLGAVVAVQELGFAVLRLGKGRSRDVTDPRSQDQQSSQADVLPGTCVDIVRLVPPEGAPVQRDLASKWSSFLAVEQSLAGQKSQQETFNFCGLNLLVPSEQLRPRGSSAALVHAAIDCLRPARGESFVLDLGVGCGALLLGVLAQKGTAIGTGVDIDEGAIAACQANALRVLPAGRAEKMAVLCADFAKLDSPDVRDQLQQDGYDVIICNPPYRSTAQQAAYDQASGQHGGYAEHEKTLVAGETGLEMYEAISACLARDMQMVQQRLLAPPGPILKLDGSLIFQVEAGSFGRLGGVAKRVAAAVHKASGGKLKFQRTILDDKQLERAILLKWSWCD